MKIVKLQSSENIADDFHCIDLPVNTHSFVMSEKLGKLLFMAKTFSKNAQRFIPKREEVKGFGLRLVSLISILVNSWFIPPSSSLGKWVKQDDM